MRKYRTVTGWAGIVVVSCVLAGCEPTPEATTAPPSSLAAIADLQQIEQAIHNPESDVTLVHVWATWCVPCREEFPELLEAFEARRGQGLDLLLLSADDPAEMDAVKQFLLDQHSPQETWVAEDIGESFINLLSPNWSGALPASFFFDSSGTLVAEWEGKRSYDEYITTIDRLLKP